MKVLMINSVCGIKSTGRICTDLAENLIKNGHKCRIAYGRDEVPEKYQKIAHRIGNDLDVRIHGLESRILDNHGLGSINATKKFVSWIERYDPDIIHLHNIHGYYLNIEILFEYIIKSAKPVIWTLHDCWPITGHCAHFSHIKCEKWKAGCGHCPQKKNYPASLLLDKSQYNWKLKKRLFTSVKYMNFVVPSKWLSDIVKESFLAKYPVIVVNNGIDTDVFKPTNSDFRKKYHIEDKKIILGVASAWGEEKGLGDFIKLSKILEKKYVIVLVGLTEKQLKKLPDNIIGIMKTNSKKELAEIYTAADVYLNLTYEDTYPTTNLEAQACGTPVITYRTGGSVESVPISNIAEQGDIKKTILLLKKKQELFCGEFSKNYMLERYYDIYKIIE